MALQNEEMDSNNMEESSCKASHPCSASSYSSTAMPLSETQKGMDNILDEHVSYWLSNCHFDRPTDRSLIHSFSSLSMTQLLHFSLTVQLALRGHICEGRKAIPTGSCG